MPDLRLSHDEAADITSYLLTLKNEDFDNLRSIDYDQEILNLHKNTWKSIKIKVLQTFEKEECHLIVFRSATPWPRAALVDFP